MVVWKTHLPGGGDGAASPWAPAGCTKTSRWTDKSRADPVGATTDLSGFRTPTLGSEVCAYFSQSCAAEEPKNAPRPPPPENHWSGGKKLQRGVESVPFKDYLTVRVRFRLF